MKLKNWMTTIGGVLSAVGTSILGMSIASDDKTLIIVGTVCSAVGTALIGTAAKDFNQSHTMKSGDGIGNPNNGDGI